MSDSKFERTRQSFVKIIRHRQDMEVAAMKLLTHPDATTEQIMEVRRALLAVHAPMERTVTALREKYPYPTISLATRPWHRKEYDKYDQAIMGTTRAHVGASEETETTLERTETNGI